MDYFGKRILILGGGSSGLSACEVLKNLGAQTHLINDTRTVILENDFIKGFDLCIISPGISIRDINVSKCLENGVKVMSELELGYTLSNSRLIGITGTNGKTTTVSIISKILSDAGIDNEPLGNIGTPFSSRAQKYGNDSVLPIEVSSFQLEAIHDFKPDIAAITNITPDHLDRHLTMQKYIECKMKLFSNQTKSDFAIINYDQPEIFPYFKTESNKLYISTQQQVQGAYSLNGRMYIDGKYLMRTNDLKIIGTHNVYNALMAGLCTYLCGIDIENIRNTLKEFSGVKHRLQHVGTLDGINFLNDSKATNPDAAIVAIKSMKIPTILILGGSDKGLGYLDFFNDIKNNYKKIKYFVVCGAVKNRMLQAISDCGLNNKTVEADNFTDAFYKSVELARSLSPCNVLLSPACSSFDEFVNFEARGQKFIDLVHDLISKSLTK